MSSGEMENPTTDSDTATTKGTAPPAKRLPPIKAPVGLAKGPDLKNCKSKVGSLNNIKHIPASSGISIPTQKLKWNAKSKVGSLENKEHKPGGGNRKLETRKLEWNTTSKVQSLQNINHKPKGGNVKIFNESYGNKSSAGKKVSPDAETADGGEKQSNDEQTKSLANNMRGLKL